MFFNRSTNPYYYNLDGSQITDFGFFNGNGSTPTTGLSPWGAGEPNGGNPINQEYCLQIDAGTHLWNDLACAGGPALYPLCNTSSVFAFK